MIGTFLALVVGSLQPAGAQEIDRVREELSRLLEQFRRTDSFPGATAAAMFADGRVAAAAVGWADARNKITMTPDTKMLAASIGKTFVSATALALAAEGRLGLDDPIDRWLGAEPWLRRLSNAPAITIRMLGSHTSGVLNHVSDPRFVKDWKEGREKNPDFAHRPRELIEYVVDQPAAFPPGRGYRYTDTGYLILGLVVEAAGRAPFYEQARRRFIKPFGLSSTVPSDRRQISGLATGYVGPNPFGLPEWTGTAVGSMVWNPALEWTGGGFATTTTDLVKWAKVLYEGRAIRKPYLEELLAGAVAESQDPGSARYAFGVRISETPNGRAYGHGGSIPGFRSQLLYFPAQCVALAVQVNTSTGAADRNLSRYAERLAAAVLDAAPGCATPVIRNGSTDPQADSLIARATLALGGRGALERHRTLSARGTVEVLGGYIGPYQVYRRAPSSYRTHWDIGVIKHDLGFDGRQGWEKALTVRELPPLDHARVARRAVFNGLLWHLAAGHRASMAPAKGDTSGVRFAVPGGLDETFYFDPTTALPVREVRLTRYEEGTQELSVGYGDWRRVGDIMLPHTIRESLLELPLSIRIEEYQLDVAVADTLFLNPNRAKLATPLEVSLTTIPKNVYKEHDGGVPARWQRNWGIPFGPTESWLVNVVARERWGRQVKPVGARVELFAGLRMVKSMELSEALIEAGKKYPVARFYPQDEIFHVRHHFTEQAEPGIDRMRYTLRYLTAAGRRDSARLVIPVTTYRTKTNLIAPIKGNLIAMTGHEFYELSHKYEWSQQFSWDFIGLGDNLEVERPGGAGNDRWVTNGRELVAPGDGIVVYTRNDVPDMMPSSQYLKLADPQWAIGGNSVIIDHGNGEISCLFHMQLGSVRVKLGDRVTQGQVIGVIGSSGSPGTPHVHYQLQAEPKVFGADALPVQFTNLTRARWQPGASVITPIRGVYLYAK